VYGISTSAAGTVLVSDGSQFLRSTDNGETWEIITDGPQSAFDIAHCSQDTVFAAVYSRGMYRSDDDGKTWESVNEGLRKGDDYLTLTSVTCRRDGLILTGGIDAGLFYSTDHGEHWIEWSDGLRNRTVFSVTSGKDGTVYVATGRGIHRARWPIGRGLPRGG